MKQKFVYLSSTSLIVICGLSFSANAQVCAVQPTCESLGFTQKAADCKSKLMMRCPFDTAKVFCGGDCSGFTLTSCDTTKGTCVSCDGKYKYTSCNEGWELKDGKCTPNPCGGYPLGTCQSNIGTCSESDVCLSGTTKKYKYTACKTGWNLSGGNCPINLCGGYYDCPSTATGCRVCQSGNQVEYVVTGCESGYTLSGGSCKQDSNCSGNWNRSDEYMANYTTCVGENTGTTYYKATSCRNDVVCGTCKEAPYLRNNACYCSNECIPVGDF